MNVENRNIFELVRQGELKKLQQLLDQKPQRKFLVNENNQTLLHVAVEANSLPFVKYLTSIGSDVNAPDINLFSPLHSSSFKGNLDLCHFLLKNNALPIMKAKNAYLPLHLLARFTEGYKSKELEVLRVASIMLHKMETLPNFSINICTENGDTPLHLAAATSHSLLPKFFLLNEADPFLRNKDDETPLDIANSYSKSQELKDYLNELFDQQSLLSSSIIPGPQPKSMVPSNFTASVRPSSSPIFSVSPTTLHPAPRPLPSLSVPGPSPSFHNNLNNVAINNKNDQSTQPRSQSPSTSEVNGTKPMPVKKAPPSSEKRYREFSPYYVRAIQNSLANLPKDFQWLRFSKDDTILIIQEEFDLNKKPVRYLGSHCETNENGWILPHLVIPCDSYKMMPTKGQTTLRPLATSPTVATSKSPSPSALKSRRNLPLTPRDKEVNIKAVVLVQSQIRWRLAQKELRKQRTTHFLPKSMINELISTELSYLNDLLLIKKFVDQVKVKSILTQEELKQLCPNLQEITNINTELHKQLSEYKEIGFSRDPKKFVGTIFINISEYLKVYGEFFNKFDSTFTTQLSQHKPVFAQIVQEFNNRNEVKMLGGIDFILPKPFQRLLKYPTFLGRLVEEIPKEHVEYKTLKKAFRTISTLTNELNERKKRAEGKRGVLRLQQQLKLKMNLVEASRVLLLESAVMLHHPKYVRVRLKLYMFNDLLLLTVQHRSLTSASSLHVRRFPISDSFDPVPSSDTTYEFYRCHRLDKVSVFLVPDIPGKGITNAFQLVVSEAEKANSYTLVFPSSADRQRWVSTLRNQVEINKIQQKNAISDETKATLKEGWLQKRGPLAHWKRKYFRVKGNTFFLFQSSEGSAEAEKAIVLNSETKFKRQSCDEGFEWKMTAGLREYYFRTESANDGYNWFSFMSNLAHSTSAPRSPML